MADVTAIRDKRISAVLAAWGSRLGWRGYLTQFVSPFVGACSYHFELHIPSGMQLLASGLLGRESEAAFEDPHRTHLYVENASNARTEYPYMQFRVRGPGFVGAAFMTSLLIFASLAAAWYKAPELKDATTSAPSLLLLFPGLIATYVARPAHPLVTRLLSLARRVLVLTGALAYVAAGRLALVTSQHKTSAHALRMWFGPMTVLAGILCIFLLATWRLPRPLSSKARKLLRPRQEATESGLRP